MKVNSRHCGTFKGMRTSPLGNKMAKAITFVLTEECNFRCTYCYLVHKNSKKRMTFETAKAAIDYVLENRALFNEPSVGWDFIGGEPLLEIDLIEQIVVYIKQRTYELDHPWFAASNFGATTNGALYGTAKVQRFIKKYKDSFGMSVTIDGPRHVHDIARVYKDGRGTYDDVVANIPLWQKQYPGTATKVTVAHENLRWLAESILHIFDLGIKEIHANVVFEDVWRDDDPKILEEQLDILGDAMLRTGLHRDHTCSFFNRMIGIPLDPVKDNGNWCGAGKMLAIDTQGAFYPCNRFLPFSLEKKEARAVGNIRDGIDLNRVRPFLALTRSSQSPKACMECDVAQGCAWCQGFNYDAADTPTIYSRATYICEMHKARVRANKRYWQQKDKIDGKIRETP